MNRYWGRGKGQSGRGEQASTWRRLQGLVLATASITLFTGFAPTLRPAPRASNDAAQTVEQPLRQAVEETLALPPAQRLPAQAELVRRAGQEQTAFVSLLEDEDPRVANLAAWTLAELNETSACQSLLTHGEGHAEPTLSLATSLARCGDATTLRAAALAGDAQVSDRLRAAITLSLLEDAQAAAVLRSLERDTAMADSALYLQICAGLLGEEEVRPMLERLLTHTQTRDIAAVALGRIGVRMVAIELEFATENPDPIIREAAAAALVALHIEGTQQTLERLSQDGNPRVAAFASHELRAWGHRRNATP